MLNIGLGRVGTSGAEHGEYDFDENEIFVLSTKYGMAPTISVAGMKTAIDQAVLYRQTIIMFFHKLVVTAVNADEYSIANFQAIIDYIVSKNTQVVTISQWYNKLKTL